MSRTKKQPEDKAEITEIFSSIQGEGPYVGERHIFIRFHRCNLKCAFCDVEKTKQPVDLGVEEIIDRVEKLNKTSRHTAVVLTGGEPLLHTNFLKRLLPKLKERGFRLYLETNATLHRQFKAIIDYVDIVAADIKMPSVCRQKPYWERHKSFLKIASRKNLFVKVVVSKDVDMTEFDKAIRLIKGINAHIPFVIQPQTKDNSLNLNIDAEKLLDLQTEAFKLIKRVLVIPQAHKMLGVR